MTSHQLVLRLGISVLLLVLLGGCASRVADPSNMLHEKQYYVTGKVYDQSGQPVPECQVYLIKRKLEPFGNTQESIDATMRQQMVASDASGQYMFTFEPGYYNDIWIGFSDPTGKREPRVIRINEELGDSLLDYPGISPVIVNIVLQPTKNRSM